MKTIIVLSSAIILGLAANVTVARYGHGNGQGNGDWAQMQTTRIQNRVDRLMERFDVNQDGQIALDEVQSVRTEHFNQMDVDGNELVSFDELENFRAEKREQNQATQRGKGKKGGCHGGRNNQMERLDNDGDGQISISEFTANIPLFNRFDTDENGIITKEELGQTN
ncbi:hypothetical protein QUF74_08205 [Candidatus Halobeggiatoa sp. HSG11]|nr:hypothetical protein [Candidatus Halobeggiatoa sp. HSG11]